MNELDRFLPALEFALAASVPVGLVWARLAGLRAILGAATAASVGVILALTLSSAGSLYDVGTAGACHFGPWDSDPQQLFGVGEPLLNVALFVPLGFCLALHPDSRARPIVLGTALAMPFAIELIQLRVPALGRYCDGMDIADNLIGLVVGFWLGFGLVLLARRASRLRRPEEAPGMPL